MRMVGAYTGEINSKSMFYETIQPQIFRFFPECVLAKNHRKQRKSIFVSFAHFVHMFPRPLVC